jgi:hypothetical protein
MAEYEFSESHTIGEWCERLHAITQTELETKKSQATLSIEMILILDAMYEAMSALLNTSNAGFQLSYAIEKETFDSFNATYDYLAGMAKDPTEFPYKLVTVSQKVAASFREVLKIVERPSLVESPDLRAILEDKVKISFNQNDAA